MLWCREQGESMEQSKVISIPDVLAVARRDVHGTCSKAVLHQIPASEASLFSVNPGEKLAAHMHTRIWDLFFVVCGQGEIRYRGDDGARTVSMSARAFCAIPPGCEHEVRNLSATSRSASC
jgi:mannose-6-phosphate isomerase-like protein (cupin superfamily)